MILYKGEIFENSEQSRLLSSLKTDIFSTLKNEICPNHDIVIDACDKLYRKVINHEFDSIVEPLLKSMHVSNEMFSRYASCFSKEGLLKKVKIELGDLINTPDSLNEDNTRLYVPYGVLFHIAAGNIDLLPAFSVIEGLLVGNINILKLPTGDSGLSIILLNELIKIEPRLKNYIYVFDVSSVEVDTIKFLANLSDLTIVWGGESVAKAARQFVDINTELIVWGHKISFAYIDNNIEDDELYDLAKSICLTNQLLCSSIQGVYINTNNKEDLKKFAERFLPIFKDVSNKLNTLPLTMKAKNFLTLYNEMLEGNKDSIYKDGGVSIVLKKDSKLELSLLYQNIWVKALSDDQIIECLKDNKNLLQTVSINKKLANKNIIEEKLFKAGVTRITYLNDNLRMIPGENHDGQYPLRRYIKIVEKPE